MLPEAERTMSNREEDPKGEKVVVAKFDGSFAALGRPETKRPVPWYRDRQYFLGSWLDASIWRSAVRIMSCILDLRLAAGRKTDNGVWGGL